MNTISRKPIPELRPYIHQYISQVLDNNYVAAAYPKGSFRLPDSFIRMAFHFSENIPWIEANNAKVSQPRFSVRGYQPSCVVYNTNSSLEVFSIEFTPFGFYHFFGISCSDLGGFPSELKTVLSHQYAFLTDHLYSCIFFTEKVNFLDAYFLKRTFSDYHIHNAVKVDHFIEDNITTLSVSKLASETFTTERTLRRFFYRYFGMAPKSFLKLKRFEKTMAVITMNPALSLLDVAINMGYYDLSHFHNEIKQFTGMTPYEVKSALNLLSK